MTWSAAEVAEAACAWVGVPDGSRRLETGDYLLADFPPGYDDECPTQVQWTRSDRPAAELVDEVLGHARAWQRARLGWWIRLDTRPADLGSVLEMRDAVLRDTVGVLARELTGPAGGAGGAPGDDVAADGDREGDVDGDGDGDGDGDDGGNGGVTWRLVDDAETLRDARSVYREVWGRPEPTPEQWERDLAEALRPVGERDAFHVVAYVGAEPASAGGCTRAGEVARLWGAATRPALRGRGAYRAVIGGRLAIAHQHGATLGLVKGLLSTSGPILQRLGFASYGEESLFVLDL
jgi:hypothetical protein